MSTASSTEPTTETLKLSLEQCDELRLHKEHSTSSPGTREGHPAREHHGIAEAPPLGI
jgi:hypothetical protein